MGWPCEKSLRWPSGIEPATFRSQNAALTLTLAPQDPLPPPPPQTHTNKVWNAPWYSMSVTLYHFSRLPDLASFSALWRWYKFFTVPKRTDDLENRGSWSFARKTGVRLQKHVRSVPAVRSPWLLGDWKSRPTEQLKRLVVGQTSAQAKHSELCDNHLECRYSCCVSSLYIITAWWSTEWCTVCSRSNQLQVASGSHSVLCACRYSTSSSQELRLRETAGSSILPQIESSLREMSVQVARFFDTFCLASVGLFFRFRPDQNVRCLYTY